MAKNKEPYDQLMSSIEALDAYFFRGLSDPSAPEKFEAMGHVECISDILRSNQQAIRHALSAKQTKKGSKR